MMDHQLSSHLELGSLQKTYREQRMWIGFFVFVLITISLSLYAFYFYWGSLNNIWYLAFLILMALLFTIVLVWVLYRDRISVRISVYEGGLVYQKLHDHKVILWSDIRYIRHKVRIEYDYSGANGVAVHTYGFFHKGGGETLLTLNFDGLWQPQKRRIVEMIEQATSAMLYPSALEAYQQDKDCLFGDITLSLQGVSYSGKRLPWNEVKSFGIGLGRDETIQIKRLGDRFLKKWLDVPLERVYNVEVMRKVVEVAASTHYFKIQNYPKYKTRRATEEE